VKVSGELSLSSQSTTRLYRNTLVFDVESFSDHGSSSDPMFFSIKGSDDENAINKKTPFPIEHSSTSLNLIPLAASSHRSLDNDDEVVHCTLCHGNTDYILKNPNRQIGIVRKGSTSLISCESLRLMMIDEHPDFSNWYDCDEVNKLCPCLPSACPGVCKYGNVGLPNKEVIGTTTCAELEKKARLYTDLSVNMAGCNGYMSQQNTCKCDFCTLCPDGAIPTNLDHPVYDLKSWNVRFTDGLVDSDYTCGDIDAFLAENLEYDELRHSRCERIRERYAWACGCPNVAEPDFCAVCPDSVSQPGVSDIVLFDNSQTKYNTCGKVNTYFKEALYLSTDEACVVTLHHAESRCECPGKKSCNICGDNGGSLANSFQIVEMAWGTGFLNVMCWDLFTHLHTNFKDSDDMCTNNKLKCDCIDYCPTVCSDNTNVPSTHLDKMVGNTLMTCRNLETIGIEQANDSRFPLFCGDVMRYGFKYCGCQSLPPPSTCGPCPGNKMLLDPSNQSRGCIQTADIVLSMPNPLLTKATCEQYQQHHTDNCGCNSDTAPKTLLPPPVSTASSSIEQEDTIVFSNVNPMDEPTRESAISTINPSNIPIVLDGKNVLTNPESTLSDSPSLHSASVSFQPSSVSFHPSSVSYSSTNKGKKNAQGIIPDSQGQMVAAGIIPVQIVIGTMLVMAFANN